MSHKSNDTYFEAKKERMEEAGLVYVGKNEAGEDEFLGTEEEWEKAPEEPSAEEMEDAKEISEELDREELE